MKMQKIGYNIDNMQQMLDCFTELTGVRVAYFHEAREVVTGKERQICRFCSEIRKSTGILKDVCPATELHSLKSKSIKAHICICATSAYGKPSYLCL